MKNAITREKPAFGSERPRRIADRFAHMRHYRGYGIHSPFVYTLVREVFVKDKTAVWEQGKVYEALVALDAPRRTARHMQKLCDFLNPVTTAILGKRTAPLTAGPRKTDNPATTSEHGRCAGMVIVADCSPASLRLAEESLREGNAVAVLTPHHSPEGAAFCSAIVGRRECLSIDKRAYAVFFYDKSLPRQHFRL